MLNRDEVAVKLLTAHRKRFSPADEVRLFSCPGRINLIGEHIDYNGGHVLPAAIDKSIYMAISPNGGSEFRFNDLHAGSQYALSAADAGNDALQVSKTWLYPVGALRLLGAGRGKTYDISFTSTIPVGSGMSSSAAITTVTLFGLAACGNMTVDSVSLARMGQRVEKEYAGVSCGIMDQFAVIHGKRDRAILLDTRDLTYEYVNINSADYHFVLVNSGVKHSLRDSGYNDRRNECDAALEALRKAGAGIDYLCEMDEGRLEEYRSIMPEHVYRRALHAVSEERRVISFYNHMKEGRVEEAGKDLYASHESLRRNFEVSISELDRMVEWASRSEGVFGARMMGGGFGGCTINMVRRDAVRHFLDYMGTEFSAAFGRRPETYDCTAGEGVAELN